LSSGSDSQAATPEAVVSLEVIAAEVQKAAGASSAGRAARTLPVSPGGGLRQTVVALVAGARLQEHENPGAATLQVLRGRVRLTAGADMWELGVLDLLVIPARRHGLEALADTVVLLTVAPGVRS
jgi:quercetin dioxygenase-like cupin family protein